MYAMNFIIHTCIIFYQFSHSQNFKVYKNEKNNYGVDEFLKQTLDDVEQKFEKAKKKIQTLIKVR